MQLYTHKLLKLQLWQKPEMAPGKFENERLHWQKQIWLKWENDLSILALIFTKYLLPERLPDTKS